MILELRRNAEAKQFFARVQIQTTTINLTLHKCYDLLQGSKLKLNSWKSQDIKFFKDFDGECMNEPVQRPSSFHLCNATIIFSGPHHFLPETQKYLSGGPHHVVPVTPKYLSGAPPLRPKSIFYVASTILCQKYLSGNTISY